MCGGGGGVELSWPGVGVGMGVGVGGGGHTQGVVVQLAASGYGGGIFMQREGWKEKDTAEGWTDKEGKKKTDRPKTEGQKRRVKMGYNIDPTSAHMGMHANFDPF